MNLDEDPDERTRGWRWMAASSYVVIMAARMIPQAGRPLRWTDNGLSSFPLATGLLITNYTTPSPEIEQLNKTASMSIAWV